MLLAAGGVRALAIVALPPALFVACAVAVLALAAHDLLRSRASEIALGADGLWHLTFSNGERFTGRLARAGHRGAALLVLVFERDGGAVGTARPRRVRVPVFADGVEKGDFSFLHLQLAFAAEARG